MSTRLLVVRALAVVVGTAVLAPWPLHAAEPAPAGGEGRWAVLPAAIPVAELLPEKGSGSLAVVAIPYDDGEGKLVAQELGRAALLAFKQQVKTLERVRKAERYRETPDADVAREVAAELAVEHVLVARLFPGATPEEPPKAVFTTLSRSGKTLRTAASASVVVARSGAINKGVERVFREGLAPSGGEDAPPEEGDGAPEKKRKRRKKPAEPPPEAAEEEEDDESRQDRVDERRAMGEFKARALLVTREDGALVVERNGEVLTDAELDEVGAPDLDARGERGALQYGGLGVSGLLLPGCVACPMLTAAAVFAPALLYGGVSGALSGGTAATRVTNALGNIFICGFYCGCLGSLPILLATLVGVAFTAAGAGGVGYFGFLSTPEPPVYAFVREYNRGVAREVGLPARKIPKAFR